MLRIINSSTGKAIDMRELHNAHSIRMDASADGRYAAVAYIEGPYTQVLQIWQEDGGPWWLRQLSARQDFPVDIAVSPNATYVLYEQDSPWYGSPLVVSAVNTSSTNIAWEKSLPNDRLIIPRPGKQIVATNEGVGVAHGTHLSFITHAGSLVWTRAPGTTEAIIPMGDGMIALNDRGQATRYALPEGTELWSMTIAEGVNGYSRYAKAVAYDAASSLIAVRFSSVRTIFVIEAVGGAHHAQKPFETTHSGTLAAANGIGYITIETNTSAQVVGFSLDDGATLWQAEFESEFSGTSSLIAQPGAKRVFLNHIIEGEGRPSMLRAILDRDASIPQPTGPLSITPRATAGIDTPGQVRIHWPTFDDGGFPILKQVVRYVAPDGTVSTLAELGPKARHYDDGPRLPGLPHRYEVVPVTALGEGTPAEGCTMATGALVAPIDTCAR